MARRRIDVAPVPLDRHIERGRSSACSRWACGLWATLTGAPGLSELLIFARCRTSLRHTLRKD